MKAHDPRISDDRDHKIETENPVLLWAEYVRITFPEFPVDWEQVSRWADNVEQPVSIGDWGDGERT